jgi:hypothetical protein
MSQVSATTLAIVGALALEGVPASARAGTYKTLHSFQGGQGNRVAVRITERIPRWSRGAPLPAALRLVFRAVQDYANYANPPNSAPTAREARRRTVRIPRSRALPP